MKLKFNVGQRVFYFTVEDGIARIRRDEITAITIGLAETTYSIKDRAYDEGELSETLQECADYVVHILVRDCIDSPPSAIPAPNQPPLILIKDLAPTVRLSNCLESANIATLQELATYTPSRLFKIKNFGRKCLDESEAMLAEYGMSLS